jgi:hypothetical protein
MRDKELISAQTISKHMLERHEGQKQVGNKPLPEAGQVVDHKDHLLSQLAAPKVKLLCKIEKQTANHHNMLIVGGWLIGH